MASSSTRLAPRFAWALQQLPLRPEHQLLEVGCGHGVMLRAVGERLTTGRILGIDRSATMTAQARKGNAAAIRDGRVAVRTGTLAAVAFDVPRFDLVFAINVALFARDADAELARIRASLTPEGALYLFFQAPGSAHTRQFRLGAERNLLAHGFATVVSDGSTATCVAGRLRT